MTDIPETPPEYIPFDMDCSRCEYERECFPLLKLWHLITGQCRQGRKRRNCRQQTIAEVLEQRISKNAELLGAEE